jgi:hypothetical protein
MSRFKLMLLSMFAVLSVGAIASSSASAACSGGSKSVFCLSSNNTEVAAGENALGTSGLSVLEGHAGGAALKIDCKDDTFSGELKALGGSSGEIQFLGCTVVEPTGCVVAEPIKAVFTDQLSENIMPASDLFKGSGPEEEFSTLKITVCSIAGSYPVTGLQTVELPGGETAAIEHPVVAKKAGSKLKIGVETASFSSTALVKLESGASWLVMLGI